jgi:DNA-binding XRE family transcriptional regulator
MLKLIGANVKAARSKANLTQECLAEIAGIHWQTVSYIENGKFHASIITIAKLSQALEVSPNSLLEGLPPLNAERAERIKKALSRKRSPKSKNAAAIVAV